MAQCKDCRISRRVVFVANIHDKGGHVQPVPVQLCPLHSRAEAYKEALVKIAKMAHGANCWPMPDNKYACNCHVSIAEEALGKVKE